MKSTILAYLVLCFAFLHMSFAPTSGKNKKNEGTTTTLGTTVTDGKVTTTATDTLTYTTRETVEQTVKSTVVDVTTHEEREETTATPTEVVTPGATTIFETKTAGGTPAATDGVKDNDGTTARATAGFTAEAELTEGAGTGSSVAVTAEPPAGATTSVGTAAGATPGSTAVTASAQISCYQASCTGDPTCITTVLSDSATCSTSNFCYISKYESGQTVTIRVGCTSSCTENYVQATNGATETYLKCCNTNLCNSDANVGKRGASLNTFSIWSLVFTSCVVILFK